MKKLVLLTGLFFIFCCVTRAQQDSTLDVTETIATASLKAKTIAIDMANPGEVELALKKIHTFKYLEAIMLEGETDESTLRKLIYRLSVLRNLNSLTLKENDLVKAPDNIGVLKTLQSLTIMGNPSLDYSDLFAKLKGLPLTQLSLIDNDMKKTPAHLSELTMLQKVQFSGNNQINYTELVDQLAKLPYLTTLAIPVNYLGELPRNIDQLTKLQVLDVSTNNFTELPEEISALKAINNLSIQGNLLMNPVNELKKLKGNNIQYLSLDKEISGEDIEQIRQLFPAAKIDFPAGPEDDMPLDTATTEDDAKKRVAPSPVRSGELKAKRETVILSGAYAFYPALFQGLVYNFDTLGFEERYSDLRYENGFRRVANVFFGNPKFCLRRDLFRGEAGGRRYETWFRLGPEYSYLAACFPELNAFGGMYWVYQGELSKRQFRRKFMKRFYKRKMQWNDVRIEYEKNNSQFTICLKSDSGFVRFSAYPVIPGQSLERCRQIYNRRFLLYQKYLLRRAQNFNRNLARNKIRYDRSFRLMKENAWKELQLRMSNEEKLMNEEEWLQYYDAIIANERNAIDNASLSTSFILRDLSLRGYTLMDSSVAWQPRRISASDLTKNMNVDFMDKKGTGKLAVNTIFLLDHKNKLIYRSTGTLGLAPNAIVVSPRNTFSLLVELRNGDWGIVTPDEINKQSNDPFKTHLLITLVFDKNLDTVGALLNSDAN